MKDGFGRPVDYLRISVIDKCNLRCTYCMPLAGFEWIPKSEILTYEEISEIVRQMAEMGLRSVRITGGERGALRAAGHRDGLSRSLPCGR